MIFKYYPATMDKTPSPHQQLPPISQTRDQRPTLFLSYFVSTPTKVVGRTTRCRLRQRLCAPNAPLCRQGGLPCRISNVSGHATELWKQRGTRALVARVYSYSLAGARDHQSHLPRHNRRGRHSSTTQPRCAQAHSAQPRHVRAITATRNTSYKATASRSIS